VASVEETALGRADRGQKMEDHPPMIETHESQETKTPRAITDLVAALDRLPVAERVRFERIFHVTESVGTLVAPPSMQSWIEAFFGSVEAVEQQRIVRVTNRVTFEGTLFNALRASRPMESELPEELHAIVTGGEGDPFCRPEEGTPADVFGRVAGRYAITASNIAKYDAFHGVVIFDQHNPLDLSRDSIVDCLDVALRWGQAAVAEDPEARYFFFMWNCLWKSGASILHGHSQVACTRGMHYARVEHLRRAAIHYRDGCGADYFVDLEAVHDVLGLYASRDGVRLFASLTPIKEKEVWLLADRVGPDLGDGLYRVLRCWTEQLGVTSFNVALYMPPLTPVEEDWSNFPIVVRLVDRGALLNKTADIGAMELYASSVVSSDPFKLMEFLRPAFYA
jgi:hypothetical protein